MHCLLDACRDLARRDHPPGLTELTAVLARADVDDRAAVSLARPDPRRPYGRRVVVDTPVLEGMVAQWTRAHPCAPHDHGGSIGGVRVLRGAAIHRIWRVEAGELRLVLEERKVAGDLLACGPDLVHSMVDGGDDEPLVTLHVYAAPIEHMVVYDVPTRRTLVVDGGCGAWVPMDEPELIRCWVGGYQRRPLLADEGQSWQDSTGVPSA